MTDMQAQERARFEVLLEDVRDKVTVIAEGHVLIVDKLEGLAGRVDRVEAQLDGVEVGLGAFRADSRARFDRVEGELRTFQADARVRFDRVEGELGGVKARLDGVESELGTFRAETSVRLDRIEGHLDLAPPRGGARPRRSPARGRRTRR
jgi:hypothetical protein